MQADQDPAPFKPAITLFMLLKTSPQWLALTPPERFERLESIFPPLLKRYRDRIRLRFFDVEFYDTRVTDLMLWEAADHHAWQVVVEELRETPFWDNWFSIVDILPGVEDAYADNYGRAPVTV